jgi:hypothetical protein
VPLTSTGTVRDFSHRKVKIPHHTVASSRTEDFEVQGPKEGCQLWVKGRPFSVKYDIFLVWVGNLVCNNSQNCLQHPNRNIRMITNSKQQILINPTA